MADAPPSGQAASGNPQLVADPQDPLPESNWLWRRVMAFGVVAFIAWQLHLVGGRIARQDSPIEALLSLAHWLIIAWLITVMLYMVAPSAEQVAKMLSTLSAWKSGISTSLTSRVSTEGGTAEATTVAGPAAAPPAQPAAATPQGQTYQGPDLSAVPHSDAPERPPWP